MRFGLLGPVEVWADDGAVPLERPLRRGVLAYLLLNANRVVAADQLVEALWRGVPPSSARIQVQTAISRIRRVCREARLADTLQSRPAGYLFTVHNGELDLAVFESFATRGRAAVAGGDMADAVALIRDGLRLWRGSALGGVAGAFVEAARARLEDQRLSAHDILMEAELAQGRHVEVLDELSGVVDAHPTRELPAAQLMLALYRCGRQAEALEVFARLRKHLAEHLGLDPGREICERHNAILRRDPMLDVYFSVRHQVVAAGPAMPVPAQLPAQVADFTGRAADLSALDAVAAKGIGEAVMISVIAGTAGVGKTALAVHWAHRVAHRFPDGQLFLNLRGHASAAPVRPIEALAQFLRVLGVPPESVPVELEEAAGLYRTLLASRRILVILDNAGTAEQIRPLLPGAPTCLVVVTSRDRLDGLVARDGARRLTLDALRPDEAVNLLSRVVGDDRVGAQPDAAAALAHACAYLPLALRVAAAHLAADQHRDLVGYVAEMSGDRALDTLRIATDDDSAVRAAFDLSYGVLPAPVKRLFRLLGVVPGPDVTASAVAALAGTTVAQAAPMLDRLAAAHLVDQHLPGRFTLHDLLRLYAKDRVTQEPERRAALDRLLDWYLCAARAAVAELSPVRQRRDARPAPPPPAGPPAPSFHQPADALDWLNAERLNLIAAVLLPGAEHRPPTAAALARVLGGYLPQRGYTQDWLVVAHAGVAAAGDSGSLSGRAAAERDLSLAHYYLSRFQDSFRHATAALSLARQANSGEDERAALSLLGGVCEEWAACTRRPDTFVARWPSPATSARHRRRR
ncbi:MAG TPA: BTAD domain-containing putative transcriptional regulator [Candidatus Limnocylindrales bacterium]|nr:BTAD domain-containing putative transcriptional regulator [Candidatus Limnocylindrales bacterium]